jgi:uncharacterized protein (TIGR02246 family)
MKRLGVLAVLCGVLAGSRPAVAQGPPAWAQERTRQWYAAFNAGDAVAIGRLYAPDAVLLIEGMTHAGHDAVQAFHAANFETARFDCTWTIVGLTTVDKLAAVWGEDACVDSPKTAGPAQSWKGHWLMVYQRQPDGSWLIVRDSGEDAR